MKKIVVICLVLVVLFGLGCVDKKNTSGKSQPVATAVVNADLASKTYPDLAKLVNEMNTTMAAFETDFAKADAEKDGEAIAFATDKLFGKLGGLIAEQKRILNKYPEITQGVGNADLKALQQGMADFNARLIQAISQVSAYKEDPAVMDVLNQLTNIIQANS